MNDLIVTVDLDWACEPAIEETRDFLDSSNISSTVFVTHLSSGVESAMDKIEVGLHPYFDNNSSHGSTVTEVVNHVMQLPHNLPAFRCHRFASCNFSKEAMAKAGMLISSNVCTNLEVIAPFQDRFGLLEVPIFLEDGGYLWQQHALEISQNLMDKILGQGIKVIVIHPMHFAINTPHFAYMKNIKERMSRKKWMSMTQNNLNNLRWRKGRGIRDFLVELLQILPNTSSLNDLYQSVSKSHNDHAL